MKPELQQLLDRLEEENEMKMPADEVAYLESIQSAADLSKYTDDGTGRLKALAWDAARALGLDEIEAGRIAGDFEVPKPKQEWVSMDISSGFGIDGHGSDDHDMRFETNHSSNVRPGCQWSHGTRYDENCEVCGRYSFEICNDCGCCERCHKG